MKFICCCFLLIATCHAQNFRIITVDEPPASFVNAQGEVDGYVTDIVKLMQKKMGDSSKIEVVPEVRALNVANHTANVLFFSFSRTTGREHNYHWLGLVSKKRWHLFTLQSSPLKVEQLSDLHSIGTIGVVRGDVREEWLKAEGFNNLYSVTQHKQSVQLLLKKRVDAIAYETQGLAYISQSLKLDRGVFKSAYVLNESDVYIAMSKQGTNQALLAKWQDAFNAIKLSGELLSISLKWQEKILQDYGLTVSVEDDILVF